jgi:diguanylate cyclase (GGDEF)-like protein/PAS domain S-box-containing protein
MIAESTVVWLVEDNPGDARLIQEYLKETSVGSSVEFVHLESLQDLDEASRVASCDLILLDLHLKQSSGLDTLEQCMKLLPAVPIIVLTGMESEALGLNAVRTGAQDYLIKDEINPTLLIRAISYAIERVRLSGHLRAARDERHVLNAAISQLGQGMVLADARLPGMPITFANSAFLELTGYEIDEVLGRNCRFLQGPDTDRHVVQQISKALNDQEDVSVELLNYRKDGTWFWNRLFISPVFSQDGQLTHFVGLQTDITELRKQTERLWLMEAAIEQSNESIVITTRLDLGNTPEIVYANRAFSELTGFAAADISGRTGVLLTGPGTDPALINQVTRAIQRGEAFRGESIGHKQSGAAFHMELNVSPVRDSTGLIGHHVATHADITLRKQFEQQIIHDALHDSLTGRPNRVMFSERIAQALIHAQKHDDDDFAVMLLDIDQFKIINESLGHSSGDKLIIELVNRLATAVESTDTVARLGGDDFGILVEDISNPYDAARIARRLHRAIQEPFDLGDQLVTPSASIGIVLNGAGYSSPEEIIRDADSAMYRAKKRGRGQYEIFDPELHLVAVNRLTLEADLRRAITRGEFRVYYQPIIEIATKRFAAGEALVRWQHPALGLVGPGYFLDVAVEAQLMEEIGDIVLRDAILAVRSWIDIATQHGYQHPSVTVNLDERELTSPTLVDRIERLLKSNNIDPYILVVEVTERALANNNRVPIQTIHQLSEIGVRIAIDDFGVGYSTFAILQELPVDFLKLDRSIVNPASKRRYADAILRSISSLSSELGIRTVAEGIESPQQLELARSVDIPFAQGFYLGFPAPLEATTQVLHSAIHSSDSADN